MRCLCYKCDKTFPLGAPLGFLPNADETTIVGLCRDCQQIRYGPLTEEMVAEALMSADPQRLEFGDYTRMARFVLRLLRKIDDTDGATLRGTDATVRDWLLGLARK